MLKKAPLTNLHFTKTHDFISQETDPITHNPVTRYISKFPCTGIKSLVDDEGGLSGLFVDFLERCFVFLPEKRWSASQALMHPFITTKI